MTRHARNCTAGAVYTYYEKKKDAEAGGYGTQNRRIGKDSVKDFDCCCLSLQPCRDPVITPEGYLFDKEAILQYIISKKNEISRKTKEYEKQKRKEETELAELADAERRSQVSKFVSGEKNIVSTPMNSWGAASSSSVSSVSNMTNGRDKDLPSFWIPSKTPDAKKKQYEKPAKTVLCPMTEKPLKLKDLIDVKFTLVKDPDDKQSLIVKRNRYMCAVTHDILGNSVPCVVLKNSGDVVTKECFEKLIKKDWINPINGEKLKPSDVIEMQRGGTGYAVTNINLEGKCQQPVLQA